MVGPPIREVGMAIGTFVKNATTKATEARNQKNETQNQPLPGTKTCIKRKHRMHVHCNKPLRMAGSGFPDLDQYKYLK